MNNYFAHQNPGRVYRNLAYPGSVTVTALHTYETINVPGKHKFVVVFSDGTGSLTGEGFNTQLAARHFNSIVKDSGMTSEIVQVD